MRNYPPSPKPSGTIPGFSVPPFSVQGPKGIISLAPTWIALYGDWNPFDVEVFCTDLEELPLVYKFDGVAYGLVKNPELRQHIEWVGVNIYKNEPK